MINALAGIGEFAIKFGGPPVVTRLTGAKANDIRYDHERQNFRMEYEPSANRRIAPSPGGSTTPEDSDSGTMFPVIECEVRCDMDTWAQSLDIVVDPPPQTISCLRRHKLSSEGGGLWLSLTHDAVFVDDERLQIIVRRGPGRDKGVVMVNGAKAVVDVEELPEHEIKSLARQKRVKPPRIPLDQPPVMGVIRRRRAEWDTDSDGSANGSGSATPNSENSPSSGSLPSSTPKISSPLTNFFTYAVNQAASTTQSTLAAISPSRIVEEETNLASKLPMRCALDALAWTQEHYVNGSIAGWTMVSDKGMWIRKKLVSEISPVIPLHKGEKIVEGVSAEELASVVMDPNCRKVWDERFDSVVDLESFGGESKTCFTVSKAGFPFRDRGFYLASVVARAQGRPTLSRTNSTVGNAGSHSPGGADNHAGSRNAIFCVSTSFHADYASSFAQAKYNPYVLPIGRVFIDAWVLETLDPYTKENYAVPSTRCTRIVAVDYAGSIPAAVNSLINANIPRSILAVESYLRETGLGQPLPITRLPAPGFIVTERTDDEMVRSVNWKLKRRDDARTLVQTKYNGEEKVYSSVILVKHSLDSAAPKSPSRWPEQVTPKASRTTLNAVEEGETPSTEDSTSGLPTLSPSSSSTISGLPTTSTPPAMSHQRERSSSSTSNIRGRSSSAFTVKGEVKHNTDLLVGELVIDSKLYPKGYIVVLKSLLKSSQTVVVSNTRVVKLDSLFRNDENDKEKQTIPLGYSAYTMPSSPLHSSGLNSEGPTRHLLRFTLPTAQYQISTVKDPLTGETQHPPPKPGWLTELEEGGILIQVEVRPGNVGKGKVIVIDGRGEEDGTKDGKTWNGLKGGWEMPVLNEKESLTSLGREELLDDRISKMCILSR